MITKEDFLYYVWQYGDLQTKKLQTATGEAIQIQSLGTQNHHAGPDFFNAQLRIGSQLWAGNVEMHLHSSHWFVHHHENDPNYNNVILHVVWQHDVDIYRKDNSVIPTLVLSDYTDASLVLRYQQLLNATQSWIRCEADFPALHKFSWEHWLERLYVERLEQKASEIAQLVSATKNDWEAVLFQLLAKGFGLKLNSEAFFDAARSVQFSLIRKLSAQQFSLEAFVFGIFGLFSKNSIEEPYYHRLNDEFAYVCHKFQYKITHKHTVHYFGTRPANYPTIRASQLAMLYHYEPNLFSKIIAATSLNEMYQLLQVPTSVFWETHYGFEKTSRRRLKKVSKKFIDVILINSIIPLRYCYATYQGKDATDALLSLLRSIPPEKNTIIQKFSSYPIKINDALQTQALLELKKHYCDQERCLKCAVGNALLQQKRTLSNH